MVDPSTLRGPAIALLVSLPAASGCARCSPTSTTGPDGAAPAPVLPLPELLPPPAPWAFAPKRDPRGIALPDGCRMRAPMVQAAVAPTSRFVALPRLLSTLVVADIGGDPAELAGVAAIEMDPGGASKKPVVLPWLHAGLMPPLARAADETWLAAIGQRDADGPWGVGLWRNGPVELLGEGDRFEAVDIACSGGRCAVLTNRLGKVAAAGAHVWIGSPSDHAPRWKRIEIVPVAGDSDAHPVEIAGIGQTAAMDGGAAGAVPDAGSGDSGTTAVAAGDSETTVVAALLEKGELVFVAAGVRDGTREVSRLRAPYGIIDATLAPEPLAMTYGTAPAPPGGRCLAEDGKVRFERAGQPPRELTVHAAPLSGWLRPLARGTLATFIAPLGCEVDRKVVYGVLLDAAGAPTSALMPIGDGESFAVAAQGDEVDLWVQQGEAVTWVRAACSVP